MFLNGLMNGTGIFKWRNGLVYEGELSNNSITGKGKFIWPDGSHYEGMAHDGQRSEYG
jgi:hypothetical protein